MMKFLKYLPMIGRRLLEVVVVVLLVIIMLAMWMPAKVGTSKNNDRFDFGGRGNWRNPR